MTISVAMCTFNGERYLRSQLESIAGQSIKPLELVVCDDGSTDSTIKIIEEFAQGAPFEVRVYRNPRNLGYTKNFGQAIQLCAGQFIALSDQDDLWYPEKLAALSRVLIQDRTIGGVFSDGDLVDENAQLTGRSLWQSVEFSVKEQVRFCSRGFVDVLMRRNVVTGMTLMFRTELRSQLLPIPTSWVHDAWLAWMLVLFSKLVACPQHLVAYRTHHGQQLGIPLSARQKFQFICRQGIYAFVGRSRSRNLLEFEKTAIQFEELAAYLRNSRKQFSTALLVKTLERANHSRTRLRILSRPRRARLIDIASNVTEYWNYSPRGIRAMVSDLVI